MHGSPASTSRAVRRAARVGCRSPRSSPRLSQRHRIPHDMSLPWPLGVRRSRERHPGQHPSVQPPPGGYGQRLPWA
jgi:hypothetical protein